MESIQCYVCMEFKKLNEYYKKIKICKKCKIPKNCERILCECGRYYARTYRNLYI